MSNDRTLLTKNDNLYFILYTIFNTLSRYENYDEFLDGYYKLDDNMEKKIENIEKLEKLDKTGIEPEYLLLYIIKKINEYIIINKLGIEPEYLLKIERLLENIEKLDKTIRDDILNSDDYKIIDMSDDLNLPDGTRELYFSLKNNRYNNPKLKLIPKEVWDKITFDFNSKLNPNILTGGSNIPKNIVNKILHGGDIPRLDRPFESIITNKDDGYYNINPSYSVYYILNRLVYWYNEKLLSKMISVIIDYDDKFWENYENDSKLNKVRDIVDNLKIYKEIIEKDKYEGNISSEKLDKDKDIDYIKFKIRFKKYIPENNTFDTENDINDSDDQDSEKKKIKKIYLKNLQQYSRDLIKIITKIKYDIDKMKKFESVESIFNEKYYEYIYDKKIDYIERIKKKYKESEPDKYNIIDKIVNKIFDRHQKNMKNILTYFSKITNTIITNLMFMMQNVDNYFLNIISILNTKRYYESIFKN